MQYACFKHSNFFTVNDPEINNRPDPVKGRPAFPEKMVGAEYNFKKNCTLYLGTHKAIND